MQSYCSTISQFSDWAAVLIALAALGVAIWQGYLARVHNRKSVMPRIAIKRAIPFQEGQFAGIGIANVGLGPAVIKRYQLQLDNVVYNGCDLNDLTQLIGNLAVRGPDIDGFAREQIIPQGVERWTLSWETRDNADAQSIRGRLIRLAIVVQYESIYGERFEETVRAVPDG